MAVVIAIIFLLIVMFVPFLCELDNIPSGIRVVHEKQTYSLDQDRARCVTMPTN
jgi:hypothetical protein